MSERRKEVTKMKHTHLLLMIPLVAVVALTLLVPFAVSAEGPDRCSCLGIKGVKYVYYPDPRKFGDPPIDAWYVSGNAGSSLNLTLEISNHLDYFDKWWQKVRALNPGKTRGRTFLQGSLIGGGWITVPQIWNYHPSPCPCPSL